MGPSGVGGVQGMGTGSALILIAKNARRWFGGNWVSGSGRRRAECGGSAERRGRGGRGVAV